MQVEGILHFEHEDISLNHWPKAECHSTPYDSSIWIDTGNAAFTADENVLAKWAGKRVVVMGILHAALAQNPDFDGESSGFGHMGMWMAMLAARRIDLFKDWSKQHKTSS